MAYNYLTLVNGVLNRVNEVPLTSSNFASATGVYADVKQAVNLAISDINTTDFTWPFNHTTGTQELTIDQVRYTLPETVKSVNWDNFRLRGDDDLGSNTTKLVAIDYEAYIEKFSDMEYRPTRYHSAPSNVFRAKNNTEYGVLPPPDKAYTIDFEYYILPTALEDYDDVPLVPQIFEHVIHNGAMSYAYAFRGDIEMSTLSQQIFKNLIKDMRIIYINRTEYVRGTEIRR